MPRRKLPHYILRREQGQEIIIFPCSADHEQDWQPYPVDPYVMTTHNAPFTASLLRKRQSCMYGPHTEQSMYQPGVVVNPARGQLTREIFLPCPRSRLRIWPRGTGSAVPCRVSQLILQTHAKSDIYDSVKVFTSPIFCYVKVRNNSRTMMDIVGLLHNSWTYPLVLRQSVQFLRLAELPQSNEHKHQLSSLKDDPRGGG